MPSAISIKIGDITTAVEGHPGMREFVVPQAYRPFITENQADIHIALHSGFPELEWGDKQFSSPPIWSLYQNGGSSFIHIFDHHPDLQRLLAIPSKFKRSELYFAEPEGQFRDPFFGPTIELLMINYLARGHGVILHACGIEYDGQGLLFAGESGAGKSTLANLWRLKTEAAVLSDDRTLLRMVDGKIRMYGTPWHGEAKFGSPGSVELDRIFFLRQGPFSTLRSLSNTETVIRLLQCSFPPHWEAAGMDFTLEFFENLTGRISCQELAFIPDQSAIECVKRNLSSR